MKVYKFEASWCYPCKQLARTLQNVNIEVEPIDVDSDSPLVDKYNIRNVPVLLFADDEGNELARLVGAVSGKVITDKYEELNANH